MYLNVRMGLAKLIIGIALAYSLGRSFGIVRQAATGRFYFSLDAHYAAAGRRRLFVVPIAIIGSVLIAWIATLFFRG